MLLPATRSVRASIIDTVFRPAARPPAPCTASRARVRMAVRVVSRVHCEGDGPMIRVCVAGVTGWVGRSLVPAIAAAPDLALTGAVARGAAGRRVADAVARPDLHAPAADVVVAPTVGDALGAGADVLVDYTAPEAVRANVLDAVARGVHVVVGTSGLTDAEYAEIDAAARARGVGVLAAGNFAVSAVLLQHFAAVAARHMASWEIIDYAKAGKPDAPSGTARALAHRLAQVRAPHVEVPVGDTRGAPEARGLTLNATQVHSVRLPGYVIGAEVLLGMPGERLTIRHEAGSGAEPYVGGTLLAARRVGGVVGVQRGLERLLGLEA
jgi:4-hydroxy-tetrahydrodipicolinate reductase